MAQLPECMQESFGLPSLRATSSGTGNRTITFDFGRKLVKLKFITAGFGSTDFGNIKLYMNHREIAALDHYFYSAMSVPSPGGAHASIIWWQGEKLLDGIEYTLEIHGKNNTGGSDDLYALVDYEEVKI